MAAASLKDSSVAKGDAIGVLVLDDKGKTGMGKAAGIGTARALVTPAGLAAGLSGGGLLAHVHRKNMGLDKADRDRIGRELEGGKAAVGVLAPVSEASIVAIKLTNLGGTTETHEVSDEALEETHTAATTEES